jgi:hypothetical protein
MLAALVFLLQASAQSECFESASERESLLQLAEDRFDLYDDSGWRLVSSRGGHCRIPAAELILDYIDLSDEEGLERSYLLHWHAGQLFAFADETADALRQFRLAYVSPQSSSDAIVAWNAYVTGTIAFLEDDWSGLTQARAEMPSVNAPNRPVLDGLINCFGQPYRVAYSQRCRRLTDNSE